MLVSFGGADGERITCRHVTGDAAAESQRALVDRILGCNRGARRCVSAEALLLPTMWRGEARGGGDVQTTRALKHCMTISSRSSSSRSFSLLCRDG